MQRASSLIILGTVLVLGCGTTTQVLADDLTQKIQVDLVSLGYEPGNVDGEATTDTIIAISKFQAERGLEVTGEASPQLAGILSAQITMQANGTATPTVASTEPGAAAAPAADPAALQAAQQACLQEKMAAAQVSQKKKRGLGRLLSAVTRTAYQSGNYEIAGTVSDVYNANATADDLVAAAKDLGLAEDEVVACQNP